MTKPRCCLSSSAAEWRCAVTPPASTGRTIQEGRHGSTRRIETRPAHVVARTPRRMYQRCVQRLRWRWRWRQFGRRRFRRGWTGTLVAANPGVVLGSSTNIYKNGTLVTAVPGSGAGWIDNNRLLVNMYVQGCNICTEPEPAGTAIFDASGNKVGATPLLTIGPFQVLPADTNSLYDTSTNTIVSLLTGTTTWATASLAASRTFPRAQSGGVTGSQVVFAAGNLVLAQPY